VHVVIIGAGEVGGYLAERLGSEGVDVVVIETDGTRASALAAELDIQVINGSGTSPKVLLEAGVDRASLLAAVTQIDEVNLVASMLAKEHGVQATVVRVEDDEIRGEAGKKLLRRVGADVVIDPDGETADEILELVHATGADEVYPMADGKVVVIGAVVEPNSELANLTLEEIGRTREDFVCGAITRGDETVMPGGDDVLRPGDHVRLLCHRSSRAKVLRLLGVESKRVSRAMVLGGGAVGARVAEHLEYEGVDVVLIERDMQRAQDLSERFRHVTVIQGDVTDTNLLLDESAGEMDVVVAATGEDASNVLACVFAMTEGKPFTVAVLHRLALLPLVKRLGIDAALSPRTASANAVIRHLRGGAAAVATFLKGDVEVDEIEITFGSQADGSLISELDIPKDILLGAVIRPGHEPVIARGSTDLEAGDHVVIFGRPAALTSAKTIFGS
jgi:trk system potassium uptake protein TrkA